MILVHYLTEQGFTMSESDKEAHSSIDSFSTVLSWKDFEHAYNGLSETQTLTNDTKIQIEKLAKTHLKFQEVDIITGGLLTGMLDFAITKEGKQYVAVIIIMAAENCGAPGLIDTAQL